MMKTLRTLAFTFVSLTLAACSGSTPNGVLDVNLAVERPRFGDSDPVDWPSRKPWQYPVHGIDVSKYQADINWRETKRNGIAFAFIKATEGGDHVDERFAQNWLNAGKAGVPRGAYHFYYFCRKPLEQARWFIRHVPKDPKSLPPVLDMEWNHQSKTCKHRPSPLEVRRSMVTYLNKVQLHYKKKPIVYTTVDFYKDNELNRLNGIQFWLRSVAGHPSEVYPSQKWTFWQYTGTGQVPGIEGDTDINVFGGSTSQWQKWVDAHTD